MADARCWGWNQVAAAGLWGLIGGFSLLLGAFIGTAARLPQRAISAVMALAAGAILATLVDTMTPEATETAHEWAGMITVAGFLAAFALSKLGS